MGATFSNLARAARAILGASLRNILEFYEQTQLRTPERRLSLRNEDQNFSVIIKSLPMKMICCEEGTECKLYIAIYNEENEKAVDITVYQDTATGADSEIEGVWTNPRTGDVQRINFSYPVEARAIKELLLV